MVSWTIIAIAADVQELLEKITIEKISCNFHKKYSQLWTTSLPFFSYAASENKPMNPKYTFLRTQLIFM